MKKLNIFNFMAFLGIICIWGCEEPESTDILNPHQVVGSNAELNVPSDAALWIDIPSSETTFEVTGSELADIESLMMEVVLVSKNEEDATIVSEPAQLMEISNISGLADTVTFTLTGQELLDALSLSAGDVEAGNRFQIVFSKKINGETYRDRASHSVLISCPSEIPVGIYVTGGSTEVMLTYDGSGIYTLSNLNFNYYSPSYGDIPAKFLDVCNDLTLMGFNEGTPYGIAWIGTGKYTPGDKATLSFTYADATYNASSFASAVFIQK